MSDLEIADTWDVPGVPTNIPFTEGIANTGEPENVGTGETGHHMFMQFRNGPQKSIMVCYFP